MSDVQTMETNSQPKDLELSSELSEVPMNMADEPKKESENPVNAPDLPTNDPESQEEVPTIPVSDLSDTTCTISEKDSEVPPKFLYQQPSTWILVNNDNKSTLGQHFKEFANATTIHGLQYVGEDGRNWLER